MAVRGPTREALQEQCVVAPVKDAQNLRSYFHGVRQLLFQGEAYYVEGQLVQAYVYIKRFLHLALDGMPKHKKYTKDAFVNDRIWLEKERERIFPIMESICKQLDDADERRIRAAATAAASAAAAENKRRGLASSGIATTTLGYSLDDLPEAPTGRPSSASESQPVGNSGMTPAAGAGAAGSQPFTPLPPLYPPPAPGMYVPSAPPPPSDYGSLYGDHGGVGGYGGPNYGGPGYGGVGAAAAAVGGAAALQDAFRNLSLDQSPSSAGHYPSVPQPESQQKPPSMQPSASRGFGTERKVVLPSTLVAQFEKIAKPNTDKPPYGIETCGILAGKLTHNVLEMTTLIIPKQTGTPNSVETTDETELFNYMLSNKLITLGWIHTHPKQDCFMSSVDLHTHCGYQLMLPEAVAVVYAPGDNKKRVGVFRLTQPEGMKLIQECKLKGFHQHPDDITIYEQADLTWAPVRMSIVDLR
ncbi:unnamed protein product [Ectocarpus sp. 6 AP-2014]